MDKEEYEKLIKTMYEASRQRGIHSDMHDMLFEALNTEYARVTLCDIMAERKNYREKYWNNPV